MSQKNMGSGEWCPQFILVTQKKTWNNLVQKKWNSGYKLQRVTAKDINNREKEKILKRLTGQRALQET